MKGWKNRVREDRFGVTTLRSLPFKTTGKLLRRIHWVNPRVPQQTQSRKGLVMVLKWSWWEWGSIYMTLYVLFRIFIYELAIVLRKAHLSNVPEQPTPR